MNACHNCSRASVLAFVRWFSRSFAHIVQRIHRYQNGVCLAIDENKITDSPQSTERSALREATLLFRTELGNWRPRRFSLYRDRLIIQKLKDVRLASRD